MKKQTVLSSIIGLLLCFCSGCCTQGVCPYCSINLNYDRPMQPNARIYCRECRSTFLVTEGCGTWPIDGQYDAERVKSAKENQVRQAQTRAQQTMQLYMMNRQYYPSFYDSKSIYRNQPSYQPINPYEGWQDRKAFYDYIDGK